jgi:RimJ/RimL family protein N-acetyltransferase
MTNADHVSSAAIDRGLVRLRPLQLADVDHVMTWVNDPEIVGNFAAFAGEAFSREQELEYLGKLLASTVDRVFSIEEAASGEYLGQVGLHQIHWRSRVGRLACIIGARPHMGRGYGSAAIAHLLDHAFGPMGLHKVWLMAFRTNTRALRTYRRIGFQQEGILREEYQHEGAWHDMVRMSLISREWGGPTTGG